MRYLFIFITFLLLSCAKKPDKPNVILIMADDMGYECLSMNGARHYQTPNLDRLARNGIRFNNTFSQPLCTPSRVKIMTGKYNYRNYEYFGYLNPDQKTFGNLMKEAGYKTCISGKWQLNGLSFKRPGYEDVTRPNHFGFEEYCLWQLNRPRKDGERFANPLITQNGKELTGLEDAYGPDVFANYILDFIERNAATPFFVYYPMVLVHEPFVPTPDVHAWENPTLRYQKDTAYFKDMMAYTDKIIGKIERKLIELAIDEHTLLIFTADNGTDTHIVTHTDKGPYPGGKSYTTQRGIHVPMIASWPGKISKPTDYFGLIDFNDFYPTLAEIAGINVEEEHLDGRSFLSILYGNNEEINSTSLIHYDPEWGKTSQRRNRFVLDGQYKLYQNGDFYNYLTDIDERSVLEDLSSQQALIKKRFEKELNDADDVSPWIEKDTN